jgi:hypothetical protein
VRFGFIIMTSRGRGGFLLTPPVFSFLKGSRYEEERCPFRERGYEVVISGKYPILKRLGSANNNGHDFHTGEVEYL